MAVWPLHACGQCYPCSIGRQNTCDQFRLTGIHLDGGLQERLTIGQDQVFPIEYANRMKEQLPHAAGPKTYDKAAHFLQDDRGPEIAADVVSFLNRVVGATP